MITPTNLAKVFLCYAFCLFYSALVGLGLLFKRVFNRQPEFWEVKQRNKPKILSSDEYGEHKFMKVNGVKLHYVEAGAKNAGKKPLLLFVHGFPEFWYSWRYQLKEFSRDYHCIAIDQRGYSESDKPTRISDYFIDNMVEDIHEFVKQLGGEKFILIAHDWGAVVGFRYALKHMDQLEKYVMIGGPPFEVWTQMIFSSVKQFLMSWYVFYFQMWWLPEYATRLQDMRVFKAMQTTEEDAEVYKYVFSREDALTGPINYYRAGIFSMLSDSPLPKPSNFKPGLFMIGEKDRYIAQDSAKIAKQLYENLDFKVIKGANHFAQQHAPEETNRLIREFIQ